MNGHDRPIMPFSFANKKTPKNKMKWNKQSHLCATCSSRIKSDSSLQSGYRLQASSAGMHSWFLHVNSRWALHGAKTEETILKSALSNSNVSIIKLKTAMAKLKDSDPHKIWKPGNLSKFNVQHVMKITNPYAYDERNKLIQFILN